MILPAQSSSALQYGACALDCSSKIRRASRAIMASQ
jgi:hypothetical protein